MGIRVGFLGPQWTTFGWDAARGFFDDPNYSDVVYVPYQTHPQVCQAVGADEVSYGVVGFHNSIDGLVEATIRSYVEQALRHGFYICGEAKVPIELYYLAHPECEGLTDIASHPKALGQCSRFVDSTGLKRVNTGSTGEGAELASQNMNTAALASKSAESHYKLQRLSEESVTNDSSSMTLFWILNKEYPESRGDDKSSFLITVPHEPGQLVKALSCFSAVNLLWIYGVPEKGKDFEYRHVIEVEGHVDDEAVQDAWLSLKKSFPGSAFLGSYPKAV